jgi:hypothetical protein
MTFPVSYGYGPAEKIEDGSAEAQADADGITNPNLHRRIAQGQVDGHSYSVGIYGLNSYRVDTFSNHDEDSDDSEIP